MNENIRMLLVTIFTGLLAAAVYLIAYYFWAGNFS
jgi:hypothetical protein